MRPYKVSQSATADKPGWYAFYYANKQWNEVTYAGSTNEPVRFTNSQDAMRTAKTWAEAHRCTAQ